MANFEFKPFDKVLVRNSWRMWVPAIYSMKGELNHLTSVGWQDECIPYEGNEEYIGTTKDYVDKVSKFKVGDWIIDVQGVSANQIIGYEDDSYHIKTSCSKFYLPMKLAEKNYRLWTIEDAKDGDVLHASSFSSDCIFIFNRLDKWKFDEPNGEKAVATGHCCLTLSADNMEFGIQGPDCIEVDTVKPATKEQRDLLFQKMNEAGYVFDFDKKELKKIEQKKTPVEGEFPYDNPSGTLEGEIENIWGKLNSGGRFSATKEGFREVITHFFNYIKKQDDLELVEQKPTEWSEEDEKIKKVILEALMTDDAIKILVENAIYYEGAENWLKSLKDRVQSTWKPSEEQMNALYTYIYNPQYFNSPDPRMELVESVYKDLKKIREK